MNASEHIHQRIENFVCKFGEAHLYFAYHVALPLALTPDLAYRIWYNFQRDIHGNPIKNENGRILDIPWIAVSDLLLSNFCREVAHELYEMDKDIRNALLKIMRKDERFGKERLLELSNFLMKYIENHLCSDDPYVRNIATSQKWVAMAYINPEKVTNNLTEILSSKIKNMDKNGVYRTASMIETISESLISNNLINYSQGMKFYFQGNIKKAKEYADRIIKKNGNIEYSAYEYGLKLIEDSIFRKEKEENPKPNIFKDTKKNEKFGEFGSLRIGQLVDKWDQVAHSPVGKNLMIGLGGTGKEVLLRLRRLIVEKYGTLENLPCIQFLHLDTDQTSNTQQQYDRNTQDDPLFDKIKFQPMERISLGIEGGCSKYLTNINAFPNIREWFQTKGKIKDLGDMGEGAGQVRMASRLGFYDNYPDIESGLSQAYRRLSSERVRDIVNDIGFKFDPSLMNIYVVTSIAGGTGSGTFLDMGFLLKTMFPDAIRIGILFLPSFFSGYAGKTRMQANGYAALKELNHYSFGHEFAANWTGNQVKAVYPPPFDYTYLLEGKNEAGEAIGTSNEEYSIYQMAAETVFQDFSLGDFAGMKRAIRINLKNFIDNAYVHNYWDSSSGIGSQGNQGPIRGDCYTTRFCSFGLAAIQFPTRRVHQACACRLARAILHRWRHATIADPQEPLFVKFLDHADIKFVQGQYERRDGAGVINEYHVEDALLTYNPDSDSGHGFSNYIWNKVMNARRDMETAPNGQKAEALNEHFMEWEALLAKSDSNTPDEWGADIRIVDQNMKRYIDRLEKGIEKQADELANDPKYGISYTLALLGELKKVIKSDNYCYLHYFEEQITHWDEHANYYLDQLNRLKLELGRHKNIFLFRKAHLKRDMDLLAPVDQAGEGFLYNYYMGRIMKQVCKRGKKICEYIDKKVLGEDTPSGKGLLGKYHQLTGGLSVLDKKLKNKEEYFAREEDYATIKSLYRKGDVDKWYKEWMGEPSEETQNLKEVGDRLLTKIFGVSTVSEALEHIQRQPIENIEDALLKECTEVFKRHPNQPSALEMLFDDDRCSRSVRDNLIEGSYMRAKVWMMPTRDVPQVDFKIKQEQKPCIIGIDENDTARSNEFRRLLSTKVKLGDTPPQYKNIGETNKGTIVFYNELAGATSFYPSSVAGVGGMRQSYVEFCKNPNEASPDNQEDVHIDKNRFQFGDIIPKTSDEVEQYKESIRAFALSRLLGVLRVDEVLEDDRITITNHYSYEDKIAFDTDEVNLGSEFSAVDMLFLDNRTEYMTHRKKLYDQAEKVVEKLQEKRLLSVYMMLIDFYRSYVYPPKPEMSAAGIKIRQFSPFYAALDAEMARVREQLIGDDAQEHERVENALIRLRGGKKLGRNLTYQEYAVALQPYTKALGKFEMILSGAVRSKRNFVNVLVIDQKKIDFNGLRNENEPSS